MKKVTHEVTFEGIPSGDYERFCWAVDTETFIRVVGREPDELEESRFHPGLYNLYPSQAINLSGKEGVMKFTLKVVGSPKRTLRISKADNKPL